MAKLDVKVASTSVSVNIFIQDSRSASGAGLTGLVFNTAGLTAYYALPLAASVSIALVTLAAITTAYSSGGFKEIDATNMPGWYRLDLPNAAVASGRFTGVHLQGAANMVPLPLEISLTGWDNQDAVHGGLSCLPNTAVTTNASLLTSGTGTDQLSVTSGRIDMGKILGTAVSTPATAGILDVNIKNIANAAVSATTAQLGVNVVNWNNTVVATPATAGIPDVNVKNINNVAAATPGASGGILISGSNSGTTTLAALTITGTMTVSDGIVVARSTANSDAVKFTGTGSGNGLNITGGAAITTTAAGNGILITGGAASTGAGGVAGAAVKATGGAGAASTNGSASAVIVAAGGTTTVSGNDAVTYTGTGNGNALTLAHAGTGKDFNATTTPLTLAKTTNITGFNDLAGSAIATAVWQDTTSGDFTVASSIGKSLYTSGAVPGAAGGLFIAGTNAATTVNFTGNLSGSVGSVTGAVGSVTGITSSDVGAIKTQTDKLTFTVPNQIDANVLDWKSSAAPAMTGDAFARLGAPAGASVSADIAAVKVDTAAIKVKTDQFVFTVANQVDSNVITKTGFALTAAYDLAKTAAQTGDIMKVSSGTGANQISLASGLVTVGTNNDKTGYVITSNTKKNQALAGFPFIMTDSTTHAPKPSVTVTATRSLDGAAFGACANAVTEISNGWYTIDLAAADLNANNVALKFSSVGADDTDILITTQP